ncbi:MAG: cell cycle protein [Gemmatimonadetes bacterium]|nr:cell cycle protein [Gemmatimonadota bacterium]
MMDIRGLFRRGRTAAAGPMGVQVRLKAHNRPSAQRAGLVLPGPLWWALVLAVAFYAMAHVSVMEGVWPVHGTAPGGGALLGRDVFALAAWLLLLAALRWLRFQGRWAIVVFPVLIFCLARPELFQVFSDPAYQARGAAKTRANELKATRSRLSTIGRAYGPERQEEVYRGPPPPLPDPFRQAVGKVTSPGDVLSGFATNASVFIAPLALLLGYLAARRRERLRKFREKRLLPFALLMCVFGVLAFVYTSAATGKVGNTTPWELFLPVFVAVWAATLADDAYNLARPGQVVAPRRLGALFLYGVLPIVPFLRIHELGLTIVLALAMAAMLLVGTRRGWWAALLLVVWTGMAYEVFQHDQRSQIRFELAYHPYKPLAAFPSDSARNVWAGKLHQMKLFDANVLEGDVLGTGAGRGHGETAPNSADDGYITLFAAQWGLLGGVALVLLYTLFLMHLFAAAAREEGAFERTLITGLAMLIGVPFWLAALGGMRVVPLTGVVAAFAANGGAKLLASAFGVGVIAGLSHLRTEEERLQNALAAPPVAPSAPGVRVR